MQRISIALRVYMGYIFRYALVHHFNTSCSH